ncbi:MAG: Ig-like domain-containing protein [Patescibacteria group bacterium]
MLTNAAIGLVIVLSAWGITTFVINALLTATGGNNGGAGGTGTGGTGGTGFGGGGSSQAFQISSITPTGQTQIRNVQPRVIFTRPVESTTTALTVVKTSDQAPVAGSWAISGSVATFTPAANCPAPNETKKCFESNTEYTVRVAGSIKSSTGQTITCGGIAPACSASFTSGSIVDTQPPQVTITAPSNGQAFVASDTLSVHTQSTDDSGISMVEVMVDGQVITVANLPSGQVSTSTILTSNIWLSTTAPGSHVVTARAYDLDSNQTVSAPVTIVVRPAYCSNGVKDGDETALDCGGSCGACAGSTCTNNNECASGACVNNLCVDSPLITGISPLDGRPGTIVTISGRGFGAAAGTVRFANGVTASPAQACTASGVSTWTNNAILVEVPAGAVSGPIEVQHATNNLKDVSNDAIGPVIDLFTVNNVAHPAICQVTQGQGIAVIASKSAVRVWRYGWPRSLCGSRSGGSANLWSDDHRVKTPGLYASSGYPVTIVSNGANSNQGLMTLELIRVRKASPKINDLCGSRRVYYYHDAQGTNFGGTVGKVTF